MNTWSKITFMLSEEDVNSVCSDEADVFFYHSNENHNNFDSSTIFNSYANNEEKSIYIFNPPNIPKSLIYVRICINEEKVSTHQLSVYSEVPFILDEFIENIEIIIFVDRYTCIYYCTHNLRLQ